MRRLVVVATLLLVASTIVVGGVQQTPDADNTVTRHLARLGFDLDSYQPLAGGIDLRRPLTQATVRRLRQRAADRFERDLGRLQTRSLAT